MKVLIIDWNQKRSYGVRTYIKQKIINGVEEIRFVNPKRGYVEHIRFRNFPQLHISQNQVIQCGFEDCGEIYLTSDCGHGSCRFKNIKALHCTGKFLMYCDFEDIRCTGIALIEMHKCRMSGCTFRNIRLEDEALLVSGHGASYISSCQLVDVTTERKDGEFFYRDEWSLWPFVDEDTKVNISEVNSDEHI